MNWSSRWSLGERERTETNQPYRVLKVFLQLPSIPALRAQHSPTFGFKGGFLFEAVSSCKQCPPGPSETTPPWNGWYLHAVSTAHLASCCPIPMAQPAPCTIPAHRESEVIVAALDAVLCLQVCHQFSALTIDGLDQVSWTQGSQCSLAASMHLWVGKPDGWAQSCGPL